MAHLLMALTALPWFKNALLPSHKSYRRDSLPLPELQLGTLVSSYRQESKDSGLCGRKLFPCPGSEILLFLVVPDTGCMVDIRSFIVLRPMPDTRTLAAVPPSSTWEGTSVGLSQHPCIIQSAGISLVKYILQDFAERSIRRTEQHRGLWKPFHCGLGHVVKLCWALLALTE